MSTFDWLAVKVLSAEGAAAIYPSDRPRITNENFECLELNSAE